MYKIPLTKGKFTIVDNEMYEELSKYKWYCTYYGYAARKSTKQEEENGHPYIVLMHRQILKIAKRYDVDHINGDRLDNRKENLRQCTRAENVRNRKKQKDSSSKYQGVYWEKKRKKWRAGICYNYKVMRLGDFDNEIEAARAYNDKAKMLHGEFAKLNIIEQI